MSANASATKAVEYKKSATDKKELKAKKPKRKTKLTKMKNR